MCGICGVIEQFETSVERTVLQRMMDAMVHRGPDQQDLVTHRNVGLGFCRLSIIDLEHGSQPISNEDGSIWMICNGEIYNYKSLRSELMGRGHQFRSESDIEVIIHLYEEKGIQCIHDLRGMFAIALWDSRKNELFLIRDFFGIKPLYYTHQNGKIVFSSELKSILAGLDSVPTIHEQALWDYFTFQYVPDPLSMIDGIRKIPPGHYLKVSTSGWTLLQYFTPSFDPDMDKSLSYFTQGIETRLRESVRLHMQADVPYGAFLSSGVDSSAIVALMREYTPSLRTFSIGFEGAPDALNELQYTSIHAKYFDTIHTEILLKPSEFRDQLANLVWNLDEPIADPSAMALFYVSRLAKKYVKVVLSGEGSDEIFAGYPIYHEPISLQIFKYMPEWCRQQLHSLANFIPNGIKGKSFLQRGAMPIERRFVGNAFIFSEERKANLFASDEFANRMEHSFRITDPLYDKASNVDEITKMQCIDLNTWLPGDILMKADKMSMANSLELRVPFIDKELFHFARTIPAKYRISGHTTKYIFREAMRSILPASIYNRPKLGFPVPTRYWLRDEMKHFAWDILNSNSATEFFNKNYLTDLMISHQSMKADRSREIWSILTFLLWHDKLKTGYSNPHSVTIAEPIFM